VLAVLADGTSVGETAATLVCTERAVYVQLTSTGRKLETRSGLEALTCAVRRGDISWPVVG
jgi:DNA-binding NarL/FixJ family response regulator